VKAAKSRREIFRFVCNRCDRKSSAKCEYCGEPYRPDTGATVGEKLVGMRIWFGEAMLKRLKARAALEHASVSDIVRDAVRSRLTSLPAGEGE
jgi:hypothetical protein